MPEKYITEKEKIGDRFRRFREKLGKAQHEFGTELNVSQSTIANIERGKSSPNISYLNYFYYNYRLDINWLLTNEGEMFFEVNPKDESYLDLVNMMQIPFIERMILAKLVESKALLREEIKTYFKKMGEKKENGS